MVVDNLGYMIDQWRGEVTSEVPETESVKLNNILFSDFKNVLKLCLTPSYGAEKNKFLVDYVFSKSLRNDVKRDVGLETCSGI